MSLVSLRAPRGRPQGLAQRGTPCGGCDGAGPRRASSTSGAWRTDLTAPGRRAAESARAAWASGERDGRGQRARLAHPAETILRGAAGAPSSCRPAPRGRHVALGDRRARPAPDHGLQQGGRCPPCRTPAMLARATGQPSRCGGCVHPLRGGRDARRATRWLAPVSPVPDARLLCHMHKAGAPCARSAAPSVLDTDARKRACVCACGRC